MDIKHQMLADQVIEETSKLFLQFLIFLFLCFVFLNPCFAESKKVVSKEPTITDSLDKIVTEIGTQVKPALEKSVIEIKKKHLILLIGTQKQGFYLDSLYNYENDLNKRKYLDWYPVESFEKIFFEKMSTGEYEYIILRMNKNLSVAYIFENFVAVMNETYSKTLSEQNRVIHYSYLIGEPLADDLSDK